MARTGKDAAIGLMRTAEPEPAPLTIRILGFGTGGVHVEDGGASAGSP